MNCHLGGRGMAPMPSLNPPMTCSSVQVVRRNWQKLLCGWSQQARLTVWADQISSLTQSLTVWLLQNFQHCALPKSLVKPSQHWQPISILQRLCGRLTRLLFSHMRLLLGELAFQVAASKRRGINCHTDTAGKSSESVQCAITGPCLRMRHRPSAYRTVPIRKICRHGVPSLDSTR